MKTFILMCPKCKSGSIAYRLVDNVELELTCTSCGYFEYAQILSSFVKEE